MSAGGSASEPVYFSTEFHFQPVVPITNTRPFVLAGLTFGGGDRAFGRARYEGSLLVASMAGAPTRP